MTLLNTDFANKLLQASDLTAQAQHAMTISLALGKGVKTGMAVAPGTGLTLVVQPGTYQAQVPDTLPSVYTYTVAPNSSGYLWVEANSNDSDIPRFDTQATNADYGSNWVCLGHFVSTSNSVAYDPAGRTAYGCLAAAATTQALVDEAVSTQVAPMVAAVAVSYVTEVPTGVIDGSNVAYTLTYAPMFGGLSIQTMGWVLSGPLSYTVTGKSLVFSAPPPVGSSIQAQYPYNPSEQ